LATIAPLPSAREPSARGTAEPPPRGRGALVVRLQALPPELIVAALALALLGTGIAFGLPILLPDLASLGFVERHYFRPLVLAVVAQTLVLTVRGARRSGREIIRAFGTAFVLVPVTILVHFNLKGWMPLVHASLFDQGLQFSDYGFGVVPGVVALRHALAAPLVARGVDVDALYHGAFVAMFFAAFAAHALFDSACGFRRLVLAVCLVLLLGGLAYWIVPAKGPFIFRTGESLAAQSAQNAMQAQFDEFTRTGVPPRGYFVAPLAAMPSLHAAHAWLFTHFAFRRLRWLFWPFALVFAWILVEAIASGWHYLLDLPAGIALAAGCAWLSRRLLPERPVPGQK
jgi:hypothetical protein